MDRNVEPHRHHHPRTPHMSRYHEHLDDDDEYGDRIERHGERPGRDTSPRRSLSESSPRRPRTPSRVRSPRRPSSRPPTRKTSSVKKPSAVDMPGLFLRAGADGGGSLSGLLKRLKSKGKGNESVRVVESKRLQRPAGPRSIRRSEREDGSGSESGSDSSWEDEPRHGKKTAVVHRGRPGLPAEHGESSRTSQHDEPGRQTQHDGYSSSGTGKQSDGTPIRSPKPARPPRRSNTTAADSRDRYHAHIRGSRHGQHTPGDSHAGESSSHHDPPSAPLPRAPRAQGRGMGQELSAPSRHTRDSGAGTLTKRPTAHGALPRTSRYGGYDVVIDGTRNDGANADHARHAVRSPRDTTRPHGAGRQHTQETKAEPSSHGRNLGSSNQRGTPSMAGSQRNGTTRASERLREPAGSGAMDRTRSFNEYLDRLGRGAPNGDIELDIRIPVSRQTTTAQTERSSRTIGEAVQQALAPAKNSSTASGRGPDGRSNRNIRQALAAPRHTTSANVPRSSNAALQTPRRAIVATRTTGPVNVRGSSDTVEQDLDRALTASRATAPIYVPVFGERENRPTLSLTRSTSVAQIPPRSGNPSDDTQRAIAASRPQASVNRAASHNDLQRAIVASRAQTRPNTVAGDGDLERAIAASRAQAPVNSVADDADLERALLASQRFHTVWTPHRLQHDVVQLTANTNPRGPLDWITRHDDLPAITTRFRMEWRIRVNLRIEANSRRKVDMDCTVAVQLHIEDMMPDSQFER